MKPTSLPLSFLLLVTACASPKIVRTISSVEKMAEVKCEEKRSYGKSEVQKCYLNAESTAKSFFVFKGAGTPEEIQYAHGFLMPQEIDSGSIEEMLGYFAREEAAMGKSKWIFTALKDCQTKRLKNSVSKEFHINISALARG